MLALLHDDQAWPGRDGPLALRRSDLITESCRQGLKPRDRLRPGSGCPLSLSGAPLQGGHFFSCIWVQPGPDALSGPAHDQAHFVLHCARGSAARVGPLERIDVGMCGPIDVTSSARTSTVGRIVNPSALAVFKLMASSDLVGFAASGSPRRARTRVAKTASRHASLLSSRKPERAPVTSGSPAGDRPDPTSPRPVAPDGFATRSGCVRTHGASAPANSGGFGARGLRIPCPCVRRPVVAWRRLAYKNRSPRCSVARNAPVGGEATRSRSLSDRPGPLEGRLL